MYCFILYHYEYVCIRDGYVKNHICFLTLTDKCHIDRDCISIPRKSVCGIDKIWKAFVTQRYISKAWIGHVH